MSTISVNQNVEISEIQKQKLKEVEELLIKVESGLWTCKTCKKTDRSKSALRKHAETHITGLSFPCQDCTEIFTTRGRLAHHKHENHRSGNMNMKQSKNYIGALFRSDDSFDPISSTLQPSSVESEEYEYKEQFYQLFGSKCYDYIEKYENIKKTFKEMTWVNRHPLLVVTHPKYRCRCHDHPFNMFKMIYPEKDMPIWSILEDERDKYHNDCYLYILNPNGENLQWKKSESLDLQMTVDSAGYIQVESKSLLQEFYGLGGQDGFVTLIYSHKPLTLSI